MVTSAELLAQHFADLHGCCWLINGEQCGLNCGHGGDHVDFTPGEYLLPPVLHPLDAARLTVFAAWRLRCCPVCGGEARDWQWERRGPVRVACFFDGQVRELVQAEWSFWPCGCEAREVLS